MLVLTLDSRLPNDCSRQEIRIESDAKKGKSELIQIGKFEEFARFYFSILNSKNGTFQGSLFDC